MELLEGDFLAVLENRVEKLRAHPDDGNFSDMTRLIISNVFTEEPSQVN